MVTSENPSFALLFPGQGSQKKGMGLELFEKSRVARDIFYLADDTLGYRVSRICFDDPNYQLLGASSDTSIIQPALLTVEYATFKHLQSEGMPNALLFSGHSLGKISALVAAGSLDFESALHLVTVRGEIMKRAKEDFNTIVILISGLEEKKARRLIGEIGEQASSFEVTVVNSGQQLLIGGLSEQWHRITHHFEIKGVKAKPFPDAPLSHHSVLLKEAQKELNRSLSQLRGKIYDAAVPILDDISKGMLKSADGIERSLRRHLIEQLVWSRNVANMEKMGIKVACEIGPKTVLKGLAKGYPSLTVYSTDTWEDIVEFQKLFKKNLLF